MVQRTKQPGGDGIFWIPVRRPGGLVLGVGPCQQFPPPGKHVGAREFSNVIFEHG
jgi:hypothetical protein